MINIISFLPLLSYFTSCYFYDNFTTYKLNSKLKSYFDNSSNNIIVGCLFNNVLIFPLFNYLQKDIETIRFLYILYGCIMIDTIEYLWHFLYHKISFLYSTGHSKHHKLQPIYPRGAMYNSDFELFTEDFTIFLFILYFNFSYYEYIFITSLAYISTVCDHTNTSPNKFHILHHNSNKKKNLHNPFYILGSYFWYL